MKLKFRTKSACRIAGISRDRFNEAVAVGNYPCAPKVARGSTRVFDQNDLICLFLYGQLLKDDFRPSIAGRLACLVHGCLNLEAGGREAEVLLVRTSAGVYEAVAGSLVRETPRRAGGDSYVFWRFSVDIENIREIIQREADEEVLIVGDDDEAGDGNN